MVARTLILFTVTALVLFGFVRLAPLDIVLKAHGYTPDQIAAMKLAVEPQPGPAPQASPSTPAATQPTKPETAGAVAPASTANDKPEALADSGAQSGPTSEEAKQAAPPRKFVATDTVNVRAGQGTDTAVVGQLKPKSVVTVIEDPAGDWMKVNSGAVTGWVYRPLFERQAN